MSLVTDFFKSIFIEKLKGLWKKSSITFKTILIILFLIVGSVGYLFLEFDGDIEINMIHKSPEKTGQNVEWVNLYFDDYLLRTTYDTSLLDLKSKSKIVGSDPTMGKLEFTRRDDDLFQTPFSLSISKVKNCELYLEIVRNGYNDTVSKSDLKVDFGGKRFYRTYIKSGYISNLAVFKNWKTFKVSTCVSDDKKLSDISIAPCKDDRLDFLQGQYLFNQYFICLDNNYTLYVQDWHKNIDKNHISFSLEKILFNKTINF